jgi:hypothetical protein
MQASLPSDKAAAREQPIHGTAMRGRLRCQQSTMPHLGGGGHPSQVIQQPILLGIVEAASRAGKQQKELALHAERCRARQSSRGMAQPSGSTPLGWASNASRLARGFKAAEILARAIIPSNGGQRVQQHLSRGPDHRGALPINTLTLPPFLASAPLSVAKVLASLLMAGVSCRERDASVLSMVVHEEISGYQSPHSTWARTHQL